MMMEDDDGSEENRVDDGEREDGSGKKKSMGKEEEDETTQWLRMIEMREYIRFAMASHIRHHTGPFTRRETKAFFH